MIGPVKGRANGPGVLVIGDDAAEYEAALEDLGADIAVARDAPEAQAAYDGQAIVLGPPDRVAASLACMDELRWVQSTWAGVTPLLKAGRRDYTLTGVKDVFGPQMAEYVFGHLLYRTQGIEAHARRQRRQAWQPEAARPLRNRCIGIMGTGSIGGHLARVARTFGMRVIGLNRSGRAVDGFEQVYGLDRLQAFLARPDFLVGVLPDTPETTRLLGREAFARLKPGATLVNVGRGNLVDETALAEALHAGHLAAAVLDVFVTEPLPSASPLWQAPNLVITPHVAAQSWPADIAALFRDNYRRYVAGRPLMYTIDFSKGY